jgi:hypothetical protein
VVDELESAGEHDYTWLFHLLPCQPETDAAKKSVFTALPEKNLLLLPASPERLDGFKMAEGVMNRRSANVKDPVAHYDAHGKSFTQTFLLAPAPGANPPDLRVEQTVRDNTIEVRVFGDRETAHLLLTRQGDANTGKYQLQFEMRR